jgi:hypothetical protein
VESRGGVREKDYPTYEARARDGMVLVSEHSHKEPRAIQSAHLFVPIAILIGACDAASHSRGEFFEGDGFG